MIKKPQPKTSNAKPQTQQKTNTKASKAKVPKQNQGSFQGKGVKVNSDQQNYNWICEACGYINKISCDQQCRICQFKPN
ncbi:hypothetical protein pb186bvf_016873 [Paramecium bursaria]